MADSRSRRRQGKRNIAGEAATAVMMGCVCALLGAGIANCYLAEHNVREVTVSVSKDFASNAESYGENYAVESVGKIEAGAKANVPVSEVTETPAPEDSKKGKIPDSDFIFPKSSELILSDAELATLTDPYSCYRAIKEIYARHGYGFYGEEGSADYEYFNSKSWYQALEKKSAVDTLAELSSEEYMNISLIDNYRALMGW